MRTTLTAPGALKKPTPDGWLLFLTRFIRLFAYGSKSVRGSQEKPVRNLKAFFGIGHYHYVVLKPSSLFALDSFAGGFVIQSFAAYWFYLRFGANPGTLGAIFFWANVFAGISALLASRITDAQR
jgi:hypothetical protein